MPAGFKWACRGAVLAEDSGESPPAGTAGGLICRTTHVPPAAANAIAITARPVAAHRE